MRCCFKHKNQILSNVEEMSIGGDFREGIFLFIGREKIKKA